MVLSDQEMECAFRVQLWFESTSMSLSGLGDVSAASCRRSSAYS